MLMHANTHSIAGISETRQTYTALAAAGTCAEAAQLFMPLPVFDDQSDLVAKQPMNSVACLLTVSAVSASSVGV